MSALRRACSVLLLGLLPTSVGAHSFGQTYTLPVPIWMYLYGAAAALVVSFVLVGYFVTPHADVRGTGDGALKQRKPGRPLGRGLVFLLRALSVSTLVFTIAAGFLGVDDPYRNINMTLFWVIFYLGFTYLTALAGDWFSILNPFRVLVDTVERARPGAFQGRYRYPDRCAYWPALMLYVAFIWIELFGRSTPFSLAVTLSLYAVVNVLGSWLVGKTAWFERCEFLGIFLGLVSRLAPVRVVSTDGRNISDVGLRRPFIGLLDKETIPVSLLLFVLFMLSSTAFDGLKETALWVGAFWTNLYQFVLIPLYGNASHVDYASIKKLFLAYQSVAVILSPALYFVVYALFIFLARTMTDGRVPFRTMLLSFGTCLVPIAFVYHVTHYYTLLEVQGVQMLRLISDPLGLGWNLFATARIPVNVIPKLAIVWHVQVFLIVAGHVVSVYLAHRQALMLFSDRRAAVLSQLPMLLLMVGFTAVGLWILSLPLESGPVRLD